MVSVTTGDLVSTFSALWMVDASPIVLLASPCATITRSGKGSLS